MSDTKRNDIKVVFREKSPSQKDDCINRSAEYDCPNRSVQEAFVEEGIPKNFSIAIRCCSNDACMAMAEEFARRIAETISKR